MPPVSLHPFLFQCFRLKQDSGANPWAYQALQEHQGLQRWLLQVRGYLQVLLKYVMYSICTCSKKIPAFSCNEAKVNTNKFL